MPPLSGLKKCVVFLPWGWKPQGYKAFAPIGAKKNVWYFYLGLEAQGYKAFNLNFFDAQI